MNINQSVALADGILAGINVVTSKKALGHCFLAGYNYKNLAEHDWSKIIYWQKNSVQPIPEVNRTLIVSLVDQLFDDSTAVVSDCGDISVQLFLFFKDIALNLSTEQGWNDLFARLKSNYLTLILEIAQADKYLKDQSYYNAGFQIGTAAKGILVEDKFVSSPQNKMQNYMALRKLSKSPIGLLVQKFIGKLSAKDSMKVFLQILQGVA